MQALSRSNAIIELDKHGILIDVNDNYLELLGYTRDELIGKPYPILTHRTNTFSKLMETIRTEGMQHGVYPRYDKAGNRHWMKLIDYPVLDMNGELEKIIEFGVDVSNEKRLEKEAERRQAELKSYLQGVNNTIASVEFNLDGCFTDANEIFLKVMGYSKEDLMNCSFSFLMGEDPSVIMMWENLRLGKFFSGEFKMKNRIGKELWLIGTFNPIIIGDTPEKIMMFAQFTTLEKEKLNDLSTMVNALKSTLPVIEFNADFACKTANEKALKIFKLSRLELRSKSILDFIAPFYHSMWENSKAKILNENFTTFQLPFANETHIMHYEVSVSVSRNLDGSIGKLILILVKEVAERTPLLATI
jgi:methyl-accepting chemotaxis protein